MFNVPCHDASLRYVRPRRYVPSATLQMLVVAVVHSRLDYGNGVLVSLPADLMRRLQSVLNAATQPIYRLRTRDDVTDALISQHWLRVLERIQYKLAVLAYRVLHRESKKGATLTMAITSILDRFAKFFHCCKEQ